MKNKKLLLIFVLFLAAFLRFYQLAQLPPGFHIDEVTVGYNAYSLMKTGKDENGNFLPLYIDSFGDFRPAGYFYLTIPAIKIFGLNELAVRFPSALFGALTVFLTYFLVKEIFAKEYPALLASFLLAISPWHIIVSRATSETSVALFLIVLGVYLFLLGVKKIKLIYFLFTLTCFFISFYMYHAPRVFIPLLAFGLLGLCWQKLKTKKIKLLVFGFLIACFLISLLVIFGGQGTGRVKQVGIFNYPGVQLRLDEQIREEKSGLNIFLVRLFHNKLVNYGLEALSNYGEYFSLDFLLIKGGLPIRYLIPEAGLLYLIELPFLFIGLFFVFKEKKRLSFLPVYWLLVSPIAASLTFEDVPNIQRAFFMLPSFQILAAYGFYKAGEIFKRKKLGRKLLISGSLLALVYNFSYFSHQYLVHQRVYRPWYRNYGLKEMVKALNELGSDYQKIILTRSHNDPYIYILFFNQYDPQRYQEQAHLRVQERWEFENYIFSPRDCPSQMMEDVLGEENILFVDKGECREMPYAQTLKTIYREDNTPVFHLRRADKELGKIYLKKGESLTREEKKK